MKYQVGDEILVLHSNEEGHIIEIMNEEMVMIEVRGVKFPAYMDQIDFPYFKRFTQKKLFPENSLQERVENFMPYYAKNGDEFLQSIFNASGVFEQQFCILREK